MGCVIVIMAY
ncbi:uncharacterized protein FTOL_13770 [Fusarium torulosum]|uniref:Uncharacterized protein n=1 Tax=Fusarium torulosum TaxID=33205 RepID=A0AAE8SQ80_9HYPO|nr:uncharacterized protein FTOL_13770 [Fusarium torulosum]